MPFELNLDYLRTDKRANVMALETVFGLLGGIVNAFDGGIAQVLLVWTFWTTFIISGNLILFTVCNVYEKIYAKLGNLLIQLEMCYIGLWIIFYAISTVLSFIQWGGSNLVAYIELVIFIFDAYLYYKKPRFTPSSAEDDDQKPPEEITTES